MPKYGCNKCGHRRCRCPKLPAVEVEAVCPAPKIRPGLPLCMTWKMTFSFFEERNISPLNFKATGLFNIHDGCLQSVSTAFYAPNRVPTSLDFEQSQICLDIPGIAGTITGEVYFFGDKGEYTAALTPYLLEDGKVVTLLTKTVQTTVSEGSNIQLIFVARLFYCACPTKKCC